jgi:hypothetical protein
MHAADTPPLLHGAERRQGRSSAGRPHHQGRQSQQARLCQGPQDPAGQGTAAAATNSSAAAATCKQPPMLLHGPLLTRPRPPPAGSTGCQDQGRACRQEGRGTGCRRCVQEEGPPQHRRPGGCGPGQVAITKAKGRQRQASHLHAYMRAHWQELRWSHKKNLVARLRRHSAAPSITMAKHTASYRPFTSFFTVQVMAHANAKRTADVAENRVTLAQGTLWPGG